MIWLIILVAFTVGVHHFVKYLLPVLRGGWCEACNHPTLHGVEHHCD